MQRVNSKFDKEDCDPCQYEGNVKNIPCRASIIYGFTCVRLYMSVCIQIRNSGWISLIFHEMPSYRTIILFLSFNITQADAKYYRSILYFIITFFKIVLLLATLFSHENFTPKQVGLRKARHSLNMALYQALQCFALSFMFAISWKQQVN